MNFYAWSMAANINMETSLFYTIPLKCSLNHRLCYETWPRPADSNKNIFSNESSTHSKKRPQPLATLLKKILWNRCFPVNFAKFFKNTFYTELFWATASEEQSKVIHDIQRGICLHVICKDLVFWVARSQDLDLRNYAF